MEHPTKQTLEQVLAMTRQMLDFAEQGDWEQVSEIEADRQKTVVERFQNSTSFDPDSPTGRQIQQIIDIDGEIHALLKQAKSSIREELLEISRVRSQAKAYENK